MGTYVPLSLTHMAAQVEGSTSSIVSSISKKSSIEDTAPEFLAAVEALKGGIEGGERKDSSHSDGVNLSGFQGRLNVMEELEKCKKQMQVTW